MTTQKSTIGRSTLFDSVHFQVVECNESNARIGLEGLMATLVERHRARVCLRAQRTQERQAANCMCVFCSAETQREKFGVTLEEMRAIDEGKAEKEKAREQSRYVRGVLAHERIRHDHRKSVAIRGLR